MTGYGDLIPQVLSAVAPVSDTVISQVQETITGVPGGLELLVAAGFDVVFETSEDGNEEGWAVWRSGNDSMMALKVANCSVCPQLLSSSKFDCPTDAQLHAVRGKQKLTDQLERLSEGRLGREGGGGGGGEGRDRGESN